MNKVSQLATKIGNWIGKDTPSSDSSLLLQSLEDRVLYSAVPLPVETVEAPVDTAEIDEVDFVAFQADPLVLPNVNTGQDGEDLNELQWEPGDFDFVDPIDATLEDLEQLVQAIEEVEERSVDTTANVDTTATAALAGLSGAVSDLVDPLAPNVLVFQEGHSFLINDEFFGDRSDPLDGFTLTRAPEHGRIFNDGFEVGEGDAVSGEAIEQDLVVFLPDLNFVGGDNFDIEVTSNSNFDSFGFRFAGIANDGVVVVGDTFVPEDAAEQIFASDISQPEVQATALSDGGYVVVTALGNDLGDLSFQRFDDDGEAIDGPVAINNTLFNPTNVEVASLDDGGFLVAFDGLTAESQAVIQRYDSNGDIVKFSNGETNALPSNLVAENVSLTNLGADRFLATFETPTDPGVTAIIYNLDGTVEREIRVQSDFSATQSVVLDTVLLADGKFAVAAARTFPFSSSVIFVDVYDAAGNLLAGDVPFGTTLTSTSSFQLVATPDNNFIALSFDGAGRFVAAIGSPDDETIRVDIRIELDELVSNSTVSEVVLEDGTLVLSHTGVDDNGALQIVGRKFDLNLNPLGEEFVISAADSGHQGNSDLVLLNNGTLVSIFESGDQDSPDLNQQQLVAAVQGFENTWISLNSVVGIDPSSTSEVIERIEFSGLPNGTRISAGVTDVNGELIFQEVFGTNPVLIFNALDSGSGEFLFMAPENTTGVFDGTITLSTIDEGSRGESISDFQVIVTLDPNVNAAPRLDGPNVFNVSEGETNVGPIQFSDPEGTAITYSVDSDQPNGDLFTIDANGNLEFVAPADFENPVGNTFSVFVNASDGNSSTTEEIEVNVLNVNEDPVFGSNPTLETPENQRFVTSIDVTDPDGDDVTLSVVGVYEGFFDINANGDLSFVNPPDYENPLDFDGANNSYRVKILADDGNGGLTTTSFGVRVTNVNESPVLVGPNVFNVDEGETSVGPIQFSDPEGDAITYSVDSGQLNGDLFTIDANGNLEFVAPADFENPVGNTFSVFVNASDGDLATTEEIEVNVLNVNEAPIFVSLPQFRVVIPENQSFITTIDVTDPEGDDLTLSVIGTYVGVIDIDANGDLSFINPPDFENPQDVFGFNNIYRVDILAEDSEGRPAVGIIRVEVTDVDESSSNETPVLVGPNVFNVDEGETNVGPIQFSDPEGTAITYSVDSAQPNGDLFTIDANGNLEFVAPADFENPVGNTFSVFVNASDGNSSTTEEIEVNVLNVNEDPVFGSNPPVEIPENQRFVTQITVADPDGDDVTLSVIGVYADLLDIDANGILSFINPPDFENPQDVNGANNGYVVEILAEDGNGGSDTTSIHVEVTDVDESSSNETPVLVGPNVFNVDEGETNVGPIQFSDPEGTAITYSVDSDQPNGDLFTIDANGNLEFVAPADFENPAGTTFSVFVNASDGNSSTTEEIEVNVLNVNEDPVFGSNPPVEIPENQRFVTQITVADPDNDDVTLSVIGTYADLFDIDANGNLSFINPPDFENPLGIVGSGNSYTVEILAEDGNGGSDTTSIQVAITDVNEAPGITGTLPVQHFEQDELGIDASVNLDFETFDPEGDVVSIALDGDRFDNNQFVVVGNRLEFVTIPQLDGGEQREYTVSVLASDGELESAPELISVVVVNENDAPEITVPVQAEPFEITAGEPLQIVQVTATDADFDDLTFEIVGDNSPLFTVDNEGWVSFGGSEAAVDSLGEGSQLEVQIRVTDGTLTSETRAIQVEVFENGEDASGGRVNVIDVESTRNTPSLPNAPDAFNAEVENTLVETGSNPSVVPAAPLGIELVPQQATSVLGTDSAGPDAATESTAATDSKIDDAETFLASVSDSVAYVYQSDSLGPQLVTQELGDIIARRSGGEGHLEESFLATYFWQGFDDSEDAYIRKNLEVDTTTFVAASAGLSLGLFSYFRVIAMATTVATQLPSWKTLDISSLITEFDEAETIHQIVDV